MGVTCELELDGETLASETVDTDNDTVARNGAMMKVLSEVDWDDDEDYTVRCS